MVAQRRNKNGSRPRKDRITNILLAGVGGQGVVVASQILGEVLFRAGFDVKRSEIHGMAQRGGSVVSQVRFGPKVFSPLIKKGEGDFLVSFEQLETLRYLDHLHLRAVLVVNQQKIPPPSVAMGLAPYPKDIPDKLAKRFKNSMVVDGLTLAQQAGNLKTVNCVLLGILSCWLAVEEKMWVKTLEEYFPPKLRKNNLRGFQTGRASICH